MPDRPRSLRRIRSFVLREGRLTRGQQQALETLWPKYGVDYRDTPLDLQRLFGNEHPVILEIGFGNGESLAEQAAAEPQHNFLGIEVHRPGVGHLLRLIEEQGLANLRLVNHDAVEVLEHMIPAQSLSGVQIYFPDPWPKKKHHKRRIVQPPFLRLLASRMRPGAFLHLATDWQDYAEHMVEALHQAGDLFENTATEGAFVPRPQRRPQTKFERRGQRLGHGTWDLVWRRRG